MVDLLGVMNATDDGAQRPLPREAEDIAILPADHEDALSTPISLGDQGSQSLPVATGMRCESKRLYEQTDSSGDKEWVEKMPANFLTSLNSEDWADYAIVERMHLVEGQQRLHSIVVNSPLLKTQLAQIFAGYPGSSIGKSSWTLEAPFNPIVHRWPEFIAACEATDADVGTQHLQLLRSAIEPHLEETFSTISEFESGGTIQFHQLWMVYKPGSIIVSDQDGVQCAFRVSSTELQVSREHGRKYFLILCGIVDYDGHRIGLGSHIEAVAQYANGKTRFELAAIPLAIHPDKIGIQQRLKTRGNKFVSLRGVKLCAFNGRAFDLSDDPARIIYVIIHSQY